MKINKNTKISDLIKYNPDVIDTIATINKHFSKLKNPILRKLLAPRVSIEDAAKIGGVDVDVLLDRLSSIGFEVERETEDTPAAASGESSGDAFEGKEIVVLDAREDLNKGFDPFNSIMKALKQLKENQALKIINTFEPLPLIKILKEKGYDFKVERPGDGLVYTYFTKTGSAGSEDNNILPEQNVENDAEVFDKVYKNFEGKMREVDVRAMEMPMPMVTILQELETLGDDEALYVHHKRIPQFLLKELQNRNYVMVGKKIDDENTKLIIYKG